MIKQGLNDVEIGVDAWIIQDGNYEEFHVGAEVRCAIEFHGDLSLSDERRAGLTHIRQNFYQVCAQVIFLKPSAWGIDFGLSVFQECRPPDFLSLGAWVKGEIGISIDPFFYKERLVNEAAIPDLFNTWQIVSITCDNTPWVEPGDGPAFRDPGNPRWTEVQCTDAWNDDAGRGSYLIRLRRLQP